MDLCITPDLAYFMKARKFSEFNQNQTHRKNLELIYKTAEEYGFYCPVIHPLRSGFRIEYKEEKYFINIILRSNILFIVGNYEGAIEQYECIGNLNETFKAIIREMNK
jgi:tRNA U34 2-thiouridine synthase MnmA/TrmU